MKKLSLILLTTGFLFAQNFAYPSILPSNKILSRGAADVGLGGSAGSLFTNTAGISKILQEYGYEVEILGVNTAVSTGSVDFAKEILNSSNDNTKLLNTIRKNQGNNNHLSFTSNLMSVSTKYDEYAFAIVPAFGGLQANLMPHSGFGSGGVLEANGMIYGGIALGLSKDFNELKIKEFALNTLAIGIGGKFVKSFSFKKDLSISDIIDNKNNFVKYLQNDIAKSASNFVLDLGLMYDITDNIYAGFSLQNLGAIGTQDIFYIPATTNIGFGYKKDFDFIALKNIKIGADYTDILYGYNQDKDFLKRTRLGISASIIDTWFLSFDGSVGLYQGAFTAGIDTRIFGVEIGYSTYAQEIGAYSGQDSDRIHNLHFGISF